ncbi:cysteine proteinase [Macrolepiota fuliginosa MF-IS2]|uniref:Ubiquitin carboxyl-terminal hydrolase n=1 Tax=Macrolepiota fuliginosa MF-IS2 TaxID=1400762 RepID=A0A9P6BY95_9AGAR|nr:cysteine proteinase [Macrolepiota fuliginosa MF-IS2]
MTSTLEQSVNPTSEPQGSKSEHWIPYECNPEVFNSWAQQAGLLTSRHQFVDIYGIDDDLLNVIPKPTKAVVLLFPEHPGIKAKQTEHEEKVNAEGQHPVDHTLLFIKQKDEKACGTIALIHAIANSDVTYLPDSPLQKFISACKDKTPDDRGELLASTDVFSRVHPNTPGQTPHPTSDEGGTYTDFHFTCYVAAPDGNIRKAAAEKQHTVTIGDQHGVGGSDVVATLPSGPPELGSSNTLKAISVPHSGQLIASGMPPAEGLLEGMRLIELDGRRPFPIDHGPCTDVLDDTINVVKKYYLSQVESVYFSLMAFGAAPPINSPFH